MSGRLVYLNGKFVPYKKAVVPIDTHALHYGTGCFEGVRAYWNEKRRKLFIFRLKDHYERLTRSAETLYMKLPGSTHKLCELTVELLRKNRYQEGVYIRPLVYKSEPVVVKFNLSKLSDGFAIFTTPLGHYLNVSSGIRTITSKWLRVDSRMIPPSAKPTGLYLNTSLAKTEAEMRGYDEAIFLNSDGSVSEGSGENIFLVVDGGLVTPATDQNILTGITRSTVIELADKELGVGTTERKILKEELFRAEEVFMTGTGAEVTPVVEVDGKKVGNGKAGSLTAKLQRHYFDVVRGDNPSYRRWLTPI